MTTPGFSAEASLRTTSTYYRTSGSLDRPKELIHPAQSYDPLCFPRCFIDCIRSSGSSSNWLYCLNQCRRACYGITY
jgi:hypothetical protein